MDFTLDRYKELLLSLQKAGFSLICYNDYLLGNLPGKFVILRHDVDLKPGNSLKTALLEKEMGAKATYYFRAVPESWDEKIIREISALGHEIGYHYESLTTCAGNLPAAYGDFCDNLARLRKLTGVSTICMHGSPRSPFDSKDIWKKYDYKALGIAGEPYLDTDFNDVFYLTDTGRRWDGYKVSIRDKVPGQERFGLSFHSTTEIVSAVCTLPPHIMMTTHPQRWTEDFCPWLRELLLQRLKNGVKRIVVEKSNLKKR